MIIVILALIGTKRLKERTSAIPAYRGQQAPNKNTDGEYPSQQHFIRHMEDPLNNSRGNIVLRI